MAPVPLGRRGSILTVAVPHASALSARCSQLSRKPLRRNNGAVERAELEATATFGGSKMQERVKIFTFVSGHGETVIEPRHEDHINQWLATAKGRLVHVSQ